MRLAFPLLPVMLALTACGGTSGLTKEQYAAKVSRLCLLASDQFRELHLEGSASDFRHYGSSIVRIDDDFLEQFAALEPPDAVAAAAAGFAKTHEDVARDDKAAIAAAKEGDDEAFRSTIVQSHKDERATFGYARTIGATGCYTG